MVKHISKSQRLERNFWKLIFIDILLPIARGGGGVSMSHFIGQLINWYDDRENQ
jgi:hypothetical protein